MKLNKKIKKKLKVRRKLRKSNVNSRFRLSVNRSSKNISAQIIDDSKNMTIVSASSVEKDVKSQNKDKKSGLSLIVADILAKRASEKNIKKVYFDRGNYKFHGRVKTFAETLRKNGMEF